MRASTRERVLGSMISSRHGVASILILAAALVFTFAWPNATSAGGGADRADVSTDLPATANDLRGPRGQNSPLLAADPTNPRFVVLANRLDAPDFGCALQLSGDGGRGWIPANPVPKLPSGAEKCYAPEVAFDRHGTLYYLFLGLAGRGNNPTGVFLTTSDDRARSFSKPRRLLGRDNYQVRMALDATKGEHGRIHVVWLQTSTSAPTGGLPAPPNPILASHSDDGGKTFSKPVEVNDPGRPLSVAPTVAVGPDHAVHVLYYDLGADRIDYQGLEGPTWPGRWSLVSSTSRDGGRHFTPGVVVDDQLKPPERVMLIYTMPPPALAVGRAGLFAAWYDARNGDWDVFLRRSSDDGRSWGRLVRVNDDRRGNGRHQYLPRLSLAPNGRLDAVFYDRRADPHNVRNELSYTYSTNAGTSFSPNLRVSSQSFDSRNGQRYLVPSAKGLVEFGGRVGLLSRDSGAVGAWTDTRNSFGTAGQDIFTANITAPRMNGHPASASSRVSKGVSAVRWLNFLMGLSILAAAAATAAGLARRRRAPRVGMALAMGLGASTVALVGVSCAGGRRHQPLPPPPAIVDVAMHEYRFDYERFIPRGRVVFHAHNHGRRSHEILLVPLPPDFPPIQEQLRSKHRRPLGTLAYLHPLAPCRSDAFAADLAPGRYAMVDFVPDRHGTPQALKGMASEFSVR